MSELLEQTYPRRIEKEIEELLDTDEIIVVTGMRRVGKTTLLQRIRKKLETENNCYFDLENILERELFQQKNYRQIFDDLVEAASLNRDERMYVFIDEIQLYPEITSVIKYLYDHYQIKFILTGSSSFYMENLFPESLAGRKFVLQLNPLDFQEFLVFKEQGNLAPFTSLAEKASTKSEYRTKNLAALYREYQNSGGFPEVVLSETRELKKRRINDIYSSYFRIDVQQLSDFRKTEAFQKLARLLLRRIGKKINVQKLSSQVGVTRKTVYSYLEFLECSYFIKRLQPFSRSPDREVSGQPKVYVADTGLACLLGNQEGGGSVLENAVFNQLRNQFDKINYYQRRSGAEIDFIVDKKIGLEVKETVRAPDIRKLNRLKKELGLSEAYVVTENYHQAPEVILACDL